ncbi:MAG: hypothetical protein HW401_600 [Parcubacteria group bacterium]|nr:hypothetical protein [Parcubacteria group bacterium]
MKYLATILLIGFVGVALFGFVWMPHQMSDHVGSDCIASLVVGKSLCPDGNNSFSYAFYHFQAYEFFSNAVIVSVAAVLAIIAFAFILTSVLKNFDPRSVSKNQIICIKKRLFEINDSLHSNLKNFIRWLSLLENSPSL